MNSLLKNIIEKSATGILIYAGKRLIDKGIICWDERKKKKEAFQKIDSSQSELRLPLLQVVSSNKYFSVGVQSPTEINAPRGRTLSGRQWFCADRNGV